MSILRLPRIRIAAYNCLNKLFKKNDKQTLESAEYPNMENDFEQNMEVLKEKQDIRFPNKSALIINCLISTLEDENSLVKKCGLDILVSYFPILGSELSENDKFIIT